MAVITSITRSAPGTVYTFPPTYPGWGKHGCPGCLGLSGDCTAAIKQTLITVSFALDDGRSGVIAVSTAATLTQVQTAISAWLTANPLVTDPLKGTTV